MTGREQFEADVRRRPTYDDGTPRRTWDQLDEVQQWSWNKPDRSPNFATDLTPAGEQTVIPGCERNASPKAVQLDLFG